MRQSRWIGKMFRGLVEIVRRRPLLKAVLSPPYRVFCKIVPPLYWRFLLREPQQWRQRLEIIMRFRRIHKAIGCLCREGFLLFLADEILRISKNVEGDIVECGVYKGGNTCKLSIVAKLVGRKLVACDSFQGLPKPKDFDASHVLQNGSVHRYEEGDYKGTIQEVRSNLDRFGEPKYVELVAGWFEHTLPSLRSRKFVFAFVDVDLYESIICCLENLYPSLQSGCKLFTDEARHMLTIKAFTDREWWRRRLGTEPPAYVLSKDIAYGYIEKPLNNI